MTQEIIGHYNDHVTSEELVAAISKLLNIEEQKVLDNMELFSNINIYIKNIIYYLSQMKNEQMLIDASHAVEFLLNFHKKNEPEKL